VFIILFTGLKPAETAPFPGGNALPPDAAHCFRRFFYMNLLFFFSYIIRESI